MNDEQSERLIAALEKGNEVLSAIHNDFISRFKQFNSDLEKYVIWLTAGRR